jgi:hypothetical protein
MSQQVLARRVLSQRATGIGLRLATLRVGGLPRICLGLFLVGCAVSKLASRSGASLVSPAAGDAAASAIERVTFGLVTGHAALLTTAALEVLIGLLLLSHRSCRAGAVLLAGALVATVSPLLLFVDHVLAWPAAQSVLGVADTALACVAMVVAACAFAGDREGNREGNRASPD